MAALHLLTTPVIWKPVLNSKSPRWCIPIIPFHGLTNTTRLPDTLTMVPGEAEGPMGVLVGEWVGVGLWEGAKSNPQQAIQWLDGTCPSPPPHTPPALPAARASERVRTELPRQWAPQLLELSPKMGLSLSRDGALVEFPSREAILEADQLACLWMYPRLTLFLGSVRTPFHQNLRALGNM